MPARVAAVRPLGAIEGGRITIDGADFPIDGPALPGVRVGDHPARVVYASKTRIVAVVPSVPFNGRGVPLRIDGVSGETPFVSIAQSVATGLHQVDNPAFDVDGNLYVTYSGTRGEQVPVSIFRVRRDGTREPFSSGIVNPTSMAVGPDGRLYVSSRFEGAVYRVARDGSVEPFASDLGVSCGLAFDSDGTLFVGDRTGTIFKVDPAGQAKTFATVPPSVAAFHLAIGPEGALYVSAPTLAAYDAVYRVDRTGTVNAARTGFGRPQGLAFDSTGTLFVVEALAGASGLYRVPRNGAPELVIAGPSLVGVAFDPRGGIVVCSNDTAYRIEGAERPLR
jgi:sugar lactone lactonase YvrE